MEKINSMKILFLGTGAADYTGRVCVIGAELEEHSIKHLFGV